MAGREQKETKGVPWADHVGPSSTRGVNPADKSRHITPDEMEDAEASPGSLAASSPATSDSSEGSAQAPSLDDTTDARGQRDAGDRSLRSERKPDKANG